MGRIRTIKPEFFIDEELSSLDAETHLLAAGLLCYADDYGYFNANPGLIKAAVFALREPSGNIPEMLRRLQEIGYIYSGKTPEGKQVGRIVKFAEHQRVSHPSPSKIKDLAVKWESLQNPPESFVNPPESFVPEGKGKEGKVKEGEEKTAPLPIDADPAENIPEGLTAMQYAKGIFEHCRIPANGAYKLQVKMADSIGFLADEEGCELHTAAGRMMQRLQAAGKDLKLWFWLEDRKYLVSGDVYDQFVAQGA